MRFIAWFQLFRGSTEWKKSKQEKSNQRRYGTVLKKNSHPIYYFVLSHAWILAQIRVLWEQNSLYFPFLNLLIFCLYSINVMSIAEDRPILTFFKLSENKMEEFHLQCCFSNGNHALFYHETKQTEILSHSGSIYQDSASALSGILWLWIKVLWLLDHVPH